MNERKLRKHKFIMYFVSILFIERCTTLKFGFRGVEYIICIYRVRARRKMKKKLLKRKGEIIAFYDGINGLIIYMGLLFLPLRLKQMGLAPLLIIIIIYEVSAW